MPARARRRAALASGATALLLLCAAPAAAVLPIANASGDALYQRECAPCHGPAGYGDGPEKPSFVPPPRDLVAFLASVPPRQVVERLRRSRRRIIDVDPGVVAERRKRLAEEIVGHLQRLPDVDWPLVRHGADVYAERCETCHGPYARPVTPTALQGAGPSPSGKQPRPDFQKTLGDAELLRYARTDHPKLPGVAPVASEEDARALLAYLRLLSSGFARYALWCAGCHGDEGRGDGVFATGVDKPGVIIDRAYLKAQSPAELRRKVLHVITESDPSIPHFPRDLTAGQAQAIVVALQAGAAAQGAGAATPDAPAPSRTPRDTPVR